MEQSYQGNPVVVINLTYDAGIGGGDDIQGDIVIELFHNWAPVTVNNFVNLVNQSVSYTHLTLPTKRIV